MYTALHAKFTQHENLKEMLLKTGDAWLVEHTKNDRQWADGENGEGKNYLGKLLMQLREQIKSSSNLLITNSLQSIEDNVLFDREYLSKPMNTIIPYPL